MKKSLGSKQNQMTKEHIEKITKLFLENASNKDCKILDNEDFGYTKIIIEKPKSIEALKDDEKFAKLKDKDKILEKLEQLEQNPQDFKNREEFIKFLGVKLKKAKKISLSIVIKLTILKKFHSKQTYKTTMTQK